MTVRRTRNRERRHNVLNAPLIEYSVKETAQYGVETDLAINLNPTWVIRALGRWMEPILSGTDAVSFAHEVEGNRVQGFFHIDGTDYILTVQKQRISINSESEPAINIMLKALIISRGYSLDRARKDPDITFRPFADLQPPLSQKIIQLGIKLGLVYAPSPTARKMTSG